MNPLLKRQIEKKLKAESDGLDLFLEAINASYINFEDQISLLQRAMKISSDELFDANKKLREEAESLKEINTNLNLIFNSMHLEIENPSKIEDYKPAEQIKKQALEIIKINTEREELLFNLEKKNQALNDYAHMVSHDLKAPLRSIDTLINWCIEDNQENLNFKSKKSLDLILFNVEKMDLLISGILDYSSIAKENTETVLLNLNNLIEETVRSLIVPKHIEIRINNQMPKVYGNPYRFHQLFQHLIQNAINNNDKEKGLIAIDFIERADEYEFIVHDNGIGIPEKHYNKIFNIFTKLESNTKSSGIGLSIVKRIVDLYKGKIWLESQENFSTTFHFTIPKKQWKNLT